MIIFMLFLSHFITFLTIKGFFKVALYKQNQNQMKKLLLIVACGLTVLVTSCQKGDTGATGATGNANVTSSTFSVTPGQWSAITGGFVANQSVSSITNAASDLVVIDYTSNGSYVALPLPNVYVTSDLLTYIYKNGQVYISYISTSGSVTVTAPTSTMTFKVTVIPPAMKKYYPETNGWDNQTTAKYILNKLKYSNQ